MVISLAIASSLYLPFVLSLIAIDLMSKIQSPTQSPNEISNSLENVNFGQIQDDITVQDELVLCPRCGVSMLLRKATKGFRVGKNFYGCPNYPQCREIKEILE